MDHEVSGKKVAWNNQSTSTVCCTQIIPAQVWACCSTVMYCLKFWVDSEEMYLSGLKEMFFWLGNCVFQLNKRKEVRRWSRQASALKLSFWEWNPGDRSLATQPVLGRPGVKLLAMTTYHRIMVWFGLEGTSKII